MNLEELSHFQIRYSHFNFDVVILGIFLEFKDFKFPHEKFEVSGLWEFYEIVVFFPQRCGRNRN